MIDTTSMSGQARLKDWRDFRTSIQSLSLEDQLKEIAIYWSAVATIPHYFNFDLPQNEWPSPWELIFEGGFCKNAIAYLMFKTIDILYKENQQNIDIKLLLIKDLERSDMYLAVLIQDQYLLNYDHSEVSLWNEVKNKCEVICDF